MPISMPEVPATPLLDNHGRPISYVRLAVTDRCNLRCFYCMPAEGVPYVARQALLSYEEMERLLRLLAGMGVSKVRITGGEPFVRRELIDFLWRIHEIPGIEAVNLTTNGVLTTPHVPALKQMGLHTVNLSLDTLDPQRFFEMTRRDEFHRVRRCLDALLEAGIPTKINAVVMSGRNTGDIVPMARLTQALPLEVRYIEEMPFNGQTGGQTAPQPGWDHKQILQTLQAAFPGLEKVADPPHSTARHFKIPGAKGKLGIIAAFTRNFCGSCNRIRLTAQGQLKTCLYDDGVLDIKGLMREGATDEELQAAFLRAFRSRAKDGFEAEARRRSQQPAAESMSTIGG